MAPKRSKKAAAPVEPVAEPPASVSDSLLDAFSAHFPLTSPIPTLVSHPHLIPSKDLSVEHDLSRNPSNLSRWLAYINQIKSVVLAAENDSRGSTDDDTVSLLGPKLATKAGREGLQRLTDVYERALQNFPTSFKLWKSYLDMRASYVLGRPARAVKIGATKKKKDKGAGEGMYGFLRGNDEELEDSERDIDVGPWQGALDGAVGIEEWRSLAAVFERALMWMPTMPRTWLSYFTIFLHPECPPALSFTHARRTFDRALRTLPGSLHDRVWRVYLRWAEQHPGPAARSVWQRYLKVDALPSEYYVEELKEQSPLEAAKRLLDLSRRATSGTYKSPETKSAFQLLSDWLDIAIASPEEVGIDLEEMQQAVNGHASTSKLNGEVKYDPPASDTDLSSHAKLDVERIIRKEGLEIYKDQAGRLWAGLAAYWIKKGDIDHAKATFEEGIASVLTIRDFTQVFDAYAEFSETYLQALMDDLATGEADEEELDAEMKAFEGLMDRRPFLVNDVLLRRNPNDVQEWEKRVALHGTDDEKVDETYQRAIKTINPRKAVGSFSGLFVAYAKFFEEGGVSEERLEPDLESARNVFENAVTIPFKRVDELAEVWCEWAEMEVRNENYDQALLLMTRATAVPRKKNISYHDDNLTAQARLFKSLKLWSFYVDLQESIGTVESTKRAYDTIFELKIANAQMVINFATFLEENEYWEESFKVYERGVDLFTYPIAFEIWNTYLVKFIARYGGEKVERTRDLFDQALESCPPKFAKPLFLLYGKFEEEHGLTKRAMNVYDRATRAVDKDDQFEAFEVLLAKTAANYGLPATRAVYQRALETLPDAATVEMCVRFAAMERKLGEIDRARAIYAHASQFCDPRTHADFWAGWNEFEIASGSEDTFREMLRIKRAVQAAHNTEAAYIRSAAAAQVRGATKSAAAAAPIANGETGDAMADLEATSAPQPSVPSVPMSGFVAAKRDTGLRRLADEDAEPQVATPPAQPVARNAEEIDLDVDEDEE